MPTATTTATATDLMIPPITIQAIGEEVAIKWADGAESFFTGERLRAASPSAETAGERDILGGLHGGQGPRDFSAVRVLGWDRIGNYAIRFDFSDGHRTGLYTYEYLRKLGDLQNP